MFRALFLILVFISLTVFAPASQKETPRHSPFDVIGKVSDDQMIARMLNFQIHLQKESEAQGCIINYGTPKQIRKRVRQIMKAFRFLKLDVSRVTIINGGNRGELSSVVWIVPRGAEMPKP